MSGGKLALTVAPPRPAGNSLITDCLGGSMYGAGRGSAGDLPQEEAA
jgi:hypothetical protein